MRKKNADDAMTTSIFGYSTRSAMAEDKNLMETLAAVCDAFIPAMDAGFVQSMVADDSVALGYDSDESRAAALAEFCDRTASSAGVPEAVMNKLQMLPPDIIDKTLLLLRALGTTPGNLLITGYARPFHTLSPAEREAAMLGLAASSLSVLRKAYRAFKGLATSAYMNMPNNPSFKVVGYDGPQVENIAQEPYKHGYEMLSIDSDTTMDVDVVIIGSGCGGGVMAAELSTAGLKVLVVEKGNFVKSKDMSQVEGECFDEMYDRGGVLTTVAIRIIQYRKAYRNNILPYDLICLCGFEIISSLGGRGYHSTRRRDVRWWHGCQLVASLSVYLLIYFLLRN